MGSEGRTVQSGLKITKVEKAALVEVFGSDGKGLRALLDTWMDQRFVFRAEVGASVPAMSDQEMFAAHPMLDDDIEVTAALAGANPQHYVLDEVSDQQVAAALDKVSQSLPTAPWVGEVADDIAPEPHRHRRGTPLSTTYVQGQKVRSFTCAEPGCPEVLHS